MTNSVDNLYLEKSEKAACKLFDDDKSNSENFFDDFSDESDQSFEYKIFKDYAKIDARLIDMGWDTKPAKSVEYGKTDQSMLNHVRNGVFFLLQLNSIIEIKYDEDQLREVIALFVSHDIHKLNERTNEFDIPLQDVETIVKDAHILDIAPNLSAEDHWCSARATHITNNSMTALLTLNFSRNVRRIRVADAFASSESLEDACGRRTIDIFNDDPILRNYELRYHKLDEVKGILTNFINKTISDYLKGNGYNLLLIYDDGCVYIVPKGTKFPKLDEDLLKHLSREVINNIREGHPIFSNQDRIKDNIEFIKNLGRYDLLDKDFIYSGAEKVVGAVIRKGIADSFGKGKITEAMAKSIKSIETLLGNDIDKTRQMVAISRIIFTISRTIISKLTDDDSLEETCIIFNISDKTKNILLNVARTNPNLLTSGGKWEYSYAIANDYLCRNVEGILFKELDGKSAVEYMTKDILSKLKLYEKWSEIDDSYIEPIKIELVEYLLDIISIDGNMFVLSNSKSKMSDTFKEYSGSGKICTLCNRGTVRTKELMKKDSIYASSFSERLPIGKPKPEKLLMCASCSMEMFLRKTGSTSEGTENLYIHLMPDYFYTPLSWDLYKYIIDKFSGDVKVQMERLAEAVFHGRSRMEAYSEWLNYLASKDKGRKMFESQMQQFGGDSAVHFGVIPMSFYKQKDNETEFQFFGSFLSLVVSAYTGMRCIVSESPIPTLCACDFKETIYFDSGNAQVKRLFGDSIRLSELDKKLKLASALIRLGYANQDNKKRDSMFPKYLRVVRNKILPGSYLLKGVARISENDYTAYNYLNEAKYIDENAGASLDE